ncbi:aminodeoxychorismate synthase component I, partial [Vibrio campbellii]
PTLACDYFSHVEHLPWAMLLRSASKDHVDSRFDILVAEPVVTITTVGNESTVTTPDEITRSSEDPFALIQALSEQYLPTIESDSELP